MIVKSKKYIFYSLIFSCFLLSNYFYIMSGSHEIGINLLVMNVVLLFSSHVIYAYIFDVTMYLAGAIFEKDEHKVSRGIAFFLGLVIVALTLIYSIKG